ncbi:MAG: DUF938 domain-containing protein [Zoogloea sp.]|nr:MAG: DUF938 domain-containing protein [Zoogloea sp.]
MFDKPYSPACDRNKEPILEVLKAHLQDPGQVLEIGSGTGQHAVHFAAAMPHLTWQCSDRPEYLPGIRQWLADAALPNTLPPLTLDVTGPWPEGLFDAVFTANTLHIMGWPEVEQLFARLPHVLAPGGRLVVYGPFNYGGRFTSASNAQFDAALRSDDPARGIRDFEAVDALASQAGLQLMEDNSLPANNRCIVWGRAAAAPLSPP